MLYGKRLAVPLRAVWNTELAKAYAEATYGTTRGYTKHRLHATVKSNTTVFCGPPIPRYIAVRRDLRELKAVRW